MQHPRAEMLRGTHITLISLPDHTHAEVLLSGVGIPSLNGPTLLPTDPTTILIIGGVDGLGNPSQYCYRVDLTTYGVSVFCEVPHSATGASYVLLDNRVYLLGGKRHERVCGLLHILDLETRTWQTQKLPPRMPARYSHSACVYEGNLLIYGGRTEERLLSDCWLYRPVSDEWLELTLDEPLAQYSAPIAVVGERVLVAGGVGAFGLYGVIFTLRPSYARTHRLIKQISIL